MAVTDPLWMQNNDYEARLDRGLIAELYDEGCVRGLKVTQRAAGANMTVDISLGRCVVQGDNEPNQGNYLVTSDAVASVTIDPAPGSNSRIDLVILQINDPQAGGAAGNNGVFTKVTGTAAASPVPPALPNSALLLAHVLVPSGKVSILNADITDMRVDAGRRCAPGTLEWSASARARSGWSFADGAAVSRTAAATLDLFDHIGTTHGVGDGSTTFNLPDGRGRALVGLSNMGTAAGNASGNTRVQSSASGGNGGEVLHTLTNTEMPSHQHTLTNHTHSINHDHAAYSQPVNTRELAGATDPLSNHHSIDQVAPPTTENITIDIPAFSGTSGPPSINLTEHTGSGVAFNVVSPYLTEYLFVRL